MKRKSKFIHFNSRKSFWKCHLENVVGKNKIGLPYTSGDLCKLIGSRDQLYDRIRKAHHNVSADDRAAFLRTRFHNLKSHIQAETPKAYWNYMAIIILPEDGTVTQIKSCCGAEQRKSPVTCDLVNDAVGKKEILNSQVGSVLTEETPLTDLHNTPDLYPAI